MFKDFEKNTDIINLEAEKDKRTIFRKAHNRENPYAQISKNVLRESRLSAKAMGLMCYFLSLPDNWEISITELIRHFSDGEKSIRAGVKELVLIGYIETHQTRNENGYFSSTAFLIHEEPIKKEISLEPSRLQPYAQKRHAVKRHADNGALLKTEDTKDRIKENNNKAKEVINIPKTTAKPKTQVEPDGSVVVSLMERLKHLAISKVLVTSWLKKYGTDYVIEKIQLMENQKPDKNPEGFLNKAITNDWKSALPKQLNNNQTKTNITKYPTHGENVAWFNSLSNNEKTKYCQMASQKHWMFTEHLKHHKISVLDPNFIDSSFFKMLMNLIGRALT